MGGKGKDDSSNLKGAVRRWAGLDGAGKATIGEGSHPLHHTRDAYEKEKERRSLFGERDEGAHDQFQDVGKGKAADGHD